MVPEEMWNALFANAVEEGLDDMIADGAVTRVAASGEAEISRIDCYRSDGLVDSKKWSHAEMEINRQISVELGQTLAEW